MKKQVFARARSGRARRSACSRRTPRRSRSRTWPRAARPERVVGMHFFNPVARDAAGRARARRRDGRRRRSRPLGRRRAARQAADPRQRRARLRRQPRAHAHDARAHGRARARHPGRGDRTRRSCRLGMPMAPSVLLQMVGPRVANHVLERMHDAFPDRFPLSPALAATPTAASRGRRRRGAAPHARARSSTPCSRRWPTRSTGCSTRASSRRRPTSTRACCSAPAGRSSSAGSRSTSTRPGCRERLFG